MRRHANERSYQQASVTTVAREIYRTEGAKGFFRGKFVDLNLFNALGVTAPITSTSLVRAYGLVVYERTKRAYVHYYNQATGVHLAESMRARGELPNLASLGCYGFSGATTGFLTTVVACKASLH